MSEKRFFTKINKNGRLIIIDKECHTEIIDLTFACEVLNILDGKLKIYNEQLGEQQATIQKQSERIRELESILADDIVRKSEIKEVWKQRTEKRW